MDRSETLKVMAVLRVAYPNYYKDGKDIQAASVLWHKMFAGDDAGIVMAAVESYIAAKRFPPTVADIKDMIQTISKPKIMTEMEAWGMVKQAIRNSAYNAIEEHNKLPELIQGIVTPQQLIDWSRLDPSTESVISSNFMRSYKAAAQHRQEMEKLPESVKRQLESAGLLQIGGGG